MPLTLVHAGPLDVRGRRVAAALSRAGQDVTAVPWERVMLRDGAPLVSGHQLRFRRGVPFETPVEAPEEVEALVCLGQGPPGLAHVVARTGRAGVTTNAPGIDGLLGRKHELELALRSYTRATGRRVHRPRTHLVGDGWTATAVAALTGQDAILKEAMGARGEGIEIALAADAARGEVAAARAGAAVVQELVQPLLADGHKVDLRVYLAVVAAARRRIYRTGPVFVRRAARSYARGELAAEITNSAMRERLGLPCAITPLAAAGLPGDTVRAVEAELPRLLEDLRRAHEWWVQEVAAACGAGDGGRRVLVWGLDVAVPPRPGPLALLEINPQPVLFCGPASCEREMEDFLAGPWAAALRGAEA